MTDPVVTDPIPAAIRWQCLPFAELSPRLLYQALALRSQVFVVEQQCVYQDPDGLDADALLVLGHAQPSGAGSLLVATARLLAPGARYEEAAIGRVCTAATHRHSGLGRALMVESLRACHHRYPGCDIRISAQAHLQRFYRSLGFETVSPSYLEDGIPHHEMLLRRPA